MAAGGSQISALHLAVAASGGVLLYAALQDMTPIEALKELTSGKTPKPVESKTSTVGKGGSGASTAAFATGDGNRLTAAADKYLGVPYRWGGTSAKGLDCSGLVVVSFQDAYGVTPPRTTYTQEPWKMLTRIERADLTAGDLVFWAGHVAIYHGGGQVIHAPHPGAVVRYEALDSAGPGRISSYRRYKGATKTMEA
jgi:cell wall-associated NlpC family hydrolase